MKGESIRREASRLGPARLLGAAPPHGSQGSGATASVSQGPHFHPAMAGFLASARLMADRESGAVVPPAGCVLVSYTPPVSRQRFGVCFAVHLGGGLPARGPHRNRRTPPIPKNVALPWSGLGLVGPVGRRGADVSRCGL